jgi:D-cysteine desulfhydrase
MKLQDFPRTSLGFFPTPVMELPRLSRALGGPFICMKRDDQTGLAMGGNKTRKLEFLLADALTRGCDTIITSGAAQSNHCRQTAAAAAGLGLQCHLVLGGEEPQRPSGNLLLDHLLGCQIHWAGAHRKGEDIQGIYRQLQDAGRRPYLVPYGGSNELGALAFASALLELDGQVRIGQFSHIVFASSSGGTQAGLILGKRLLGWPGQLLGIGIDKDEAGAPPLHRSILSLVNRTAVLLGLGQAFTARDVILNSDYLGGGYGVVGDLEREAIGLVAGTQGVLLDPVYTGRAMGGLMDMIRAGEITAHDRVLFWHTGGTPALFAYADGLDLAP